MSASSYMKADNAVRAPASSMLMKMWLLRRWRIQYSTMLRMCWLLSHTLLLVYDCL